MHHHRTPRFLRGSVTTGVVVALAASAIRASGPLGITAPLMPPSGGPLAGGGPSPSGHETPGDPLLVAAAGRPLAGTLTASIVAARPGPDPTAGTQQPAGTDGTAPADASTHLDDPIDPEDSSAPAAPNTAAPNADAPAPNAEAGTPNADAPAPNADAPAPNADAPAPRIEAAAPNAEAAEGNVGAATTSDRTRPSSEPAAGGDGGGVPGEGSPSTDRSRPTDRSPSQPPRADRGSTSPSP